MIKLRKINYFSFILGIIFLMTLTGLMSNIIPNDKNAREMSYNRLEDENNPPIIATSYVQDGIFNISEYSSYSLVDNGLLYNLKSDGLSVWNVSDPLNPTKIGSGYSISNPRFIKISEDIAYVSNGQMVLTLDISNPTNIALLDTFTGDCNTERFALNDKLLYCVDMNFGLEILNVSDPANIQEINQEYYGSIAMSRRICIYEDLAYITEDHDIRVINISNPLVIQYEDIITPTNGANDLIGEGALLVSCGGSNGHSASLIDIEDPENPNLTLLNSEDIGCMDIDGSFVFLTEVFSSQYNDQRCYVYDVENPSDPNLLVEHSYLDDDYPGGSISNIEYDNNLIYLSRSVMGIEIVDSGIDEDNDGLTNAQEVYFKLTNPSDADTDDDGLNDGEEIELGTDPLKADSDNDGLNDREETELGTDPLMVDSDNDGLNDGEEVELGYDPLNPDSDNDGFLDGKDINPLSYFMPKGLIILISCMLGISLLILLGHRVKTTIPNELRCSKLRKSNDLYLKKEFDASYELASEGFKVSTRYFIRDLKEEFYSILLKIKQQEIKRVLLDLSTKFSKLEISEIKEKCHFLTKSKKDGDVIISTIISMIENEEIYAEYFKSSGAVAFNQQANVDHLDEFMNELDNEFLDWENKEEIKDGKIEQI